MEEEKRSVCVEWRVLCWPVCCSWVSLAEVSIRLLVMLPNDEVAFVLIDLDLFLFLYSNARRSSFEDSPNFGWRWFLSSLYGVCASFVALLFILFCFFRFVSCSHSRFLIELLILVVATFRNKQSAFEQARINKQHEIHFYCFVSPSLHLILCTCWHRLFSNMEIDLLVLHSHSLLSCIVIVLGLLHRHHRHATAIQHCQKTTDYFPRHGD